MYKNLMTGLLVFVLCIVCILPAKCFAEKVDNVALGNAYLSEDTVLKFKLLDDLSSNTAKKHDTVSFLVLEDIKIRNKIIIPESSVLTGIITKAHGSRLLGESGIIYVKLDDYKLRNGKFISFNDKLKFKGGKNYLGMATGLVVPFSGLLFKGREVDYPRGAEIEYKLKDNMDLGIKEQDLFHRH